MGFFTRLATVFTGLALTVSGFFFGHHATMQTPVATSTLAVNVASTTQKQNDRATTNSASPSTKTQTPTVKESVQPQISAPAVPPNSMLCNGSYYASCTSGNNLVCPSGGGVAYCEPSAPVEQSQQSPNVSGTESPATTFAMEAECQTLGQARETQEEASWQNGGTSMDDNVQYGYSPSLNTCLYALTDTMYQFGPSGQVTLPLKPLLYGAEIWDLMSNSELYASNTLPYDSQGDVGLNALQGSINVLWAKYDALMQ